MGWSEESLLRWLAARPKPGIVVGSHAHDAAVLRAATGREVACVDQVIEGVHFLAEAPARRVGGKVVARALSDLAATAARPRAVLLAVRADGGTEERWLRGVIEGAAATAGEHGAELVAGDLASSPGPRGLMATALGVLEGRRRPPGRDRARPGQLLLLTGPVGGSRLGRHLRPRPRLDEGRWLHARGATALMDVSDGLALDLSRLARASGVRVDLERIPVHSDANRAALRSGRPARTHALVDGEDHELLATMSPADWRRAQAASLRRFPELRVVGRVETGRGLWLADDPGAPPVRWDSPGASSGPGDERGWIHGG